MVILIIYIHKLVGESGHVEYRIFLQPVNVSNRKVLSGGFHELCILGVVFARSIGMQSDSIETKLSQVVHIAAHVQLCAVRLIVAVCLCKLGRRERVKRATSQTELYTKI